MQIPTDVDEIGLSSRLLFAIPLLRMLVQAVAESEGDWSFLNVALPAGQWVGVGKSSHHENLIVSTNGGGRTKQPYPSPVHDVLVGHGFEFSLDDEGYNQFVGFETDDAFEDVAKLIIGTFQHAWGASLNEHVAIDLNISLPPSNDGGESRPRLVN